MQELRRGLLTIIQNDLAIGKLTARAVAAFATINLTTDDGMPIVAASHHYLWMNLLANENIKRLLIIAPPESAKTTWTIMAYVGCYIGFYPERSIIIGSTSGKVATKRSLSLRNLVESETWRATFPNILPVKSAEGLVWSVDEWSLAPNGIPSPGRIHPTIAAYGTGGSVIGARADLLVGDDILDFDSTRTAHQRGTVETWFYNSFLSRRKSNTGRIVLIGTSWHHADLYSKLRTEGNYVVVHLPLLSPGEEVYATITYPDNFPEDQMLGESISQPTII